VHEALAAVRGWLLAGAGGGGAASPLSMSLLGSPLNRSLRASRGATPEPPPR
jgi:hypothetical protein